GGGGGGHARAARTGIDRGLVLRDPGDLGTGGLRGQQRPAVGEDLLLPELVREPADLRLGAGVDAVEGRRSHGRAALVGQQCARAHARAAHGGHHHVAGSGELLGDREELGPPDLGVHLHVARCRALDGVLAHGGAQDRAVEATSTPLLLAVPTSTPSTALAAAVMASPSSVVVVPSSPGRSVPTHPATVGRWARSPCPTLHHAQKCGTIVPAATVCRRGTAARPRRRGGAPCSRPRWTCICCTAPPPRTTSTASDRPRWPTGWASPAPR